MAGVRYYGHYSNVARGKRKMQDEDEPVPLILESVESPSALSSGPKGLHRSSEWLYVDPEHPETIAAVLPASSNALALSPPLRPCRPQCLISPPRVTDTISHQAGRPDFA